MDGVPSGKRERWAAAQTWTKGGGANVDGGRSANVYGGRSGKRGRSRKRTECGPQTDGVRAANGRSAGRKRTERQTRTVGRGRKRVRRAER